MVRSHPSGCARGRRAGYAQWPNRAQSCECTVWVRCGRQVPISSTCPVNPDETGALRLELLAAVELLLGQPFAVCVEFKLVAVHVLLSAAENSGTFQERRGQFFQIFTHLFLLVLELLGVKVCYLQPPHTPKYWHFTSTRSGCRYGHL